MRPSFALSVTCLAQAVSAGRRSTSGHDGLDGGLARRERSHYSQQQRAASADASSRAALMARADPDDSVDRLREESLHCPMDDAGAFAESQRSFKEDKFVQEVRTCVPSLRQPSLFEEVEDDITMAVAPQQTSHQAVGLACFRSVRTWGCANSLQCNYERNCVRGLKNTCLLRTDEMNCKMLQKVPSAFKQKFDKLRVLVEVGPFAAEGTLYAEIKINDTRKSMSFQNRLRALEVATLDVDLQEYFEAREISVRDLQQLSLSFDSTPGLVKSLAKAHCARFTLKTVTVLLHHTESDLDFRYSPIAVAYPTAEDNYKIVDQTGPLEGPDLPLRQARHLNVCNVVGKIFLHAPLSIGLWQSRVGQVVVDPSRQKCWDNWGHPVYCGTLERY
ncbi:hypothetical protein DCS_08192 [Drechmeria coniospora]|uniref:Uncharacterized protein n=1 Tax=Drechmeria coniospora TaxID=98403 RepID=A0A151GGJ5_DRECN|nr:hypothetical protein DCS_08192 [Drechmeria coniospora]KYK56223.1 hypothetical protein DCS_08192 [Drechmeria coniospora]